MVHISDDGQTCVFTIRDNRIGIDPEFSDSVFQMFKRLHSRQAYPGEGLGLATCERIVTGLGGAIVSGGRSIALPCKDGFVTARRRDRAMTGLNGTDLNGARSVGILINQEPG